MKTPSRFDGYVIKGRWWKDEDGRYSPLRNAAYALRYARVPPFHNPAALRLCLYEVEQLLKQGEQLSDVFEAFAELLIHP